MFGQAELLTSAFTVLFSAGFRGRSLRESGIPPRRVCLGSSRPTRKSVRIDWTFDRKQARKKFRYKYKGKRSET